MISHPNLEQIKETLYKFKGSTKKVDGRSIVYPYDVYLCANMAGMCYSTDRYVFWDIIPALIAEHNAKVTDINDHYFNNDGNGCRIIRIEANIPNRKDPYDRPKCLYYVYEKDGSMADWIGCVCDWGEVGEIYIQNKTSLEKTINNIKLLSQLCTVELDNRTILRSPKYNIIDYISKDRPTLKTLVEVCEKWVHDWEKTM